MYELTEEHIIILEQLHQGPMGVANSWARSLKLELRLLWAGGFAKVADEQWHITDRGTAAMIEARAEEEEQS